MDLHPPPLPPWFLEHAFEEDLGSGDKTSLSTLDANVRATGTILAKEPLTVCGLSQIRQIFHHFDPSMEVDFHVSDADVVEDQTVLALVKGRAQALLQTERIALNMIQRLSGIASLTTEYANIIKDYPTRILDTRKTLPLYRDLEKYAVRCGGGHNHRMRLDHEMMIKDNHITANDGNVALTVQKAKSAYPDVFLVVEIAQLDQIEPAVEQGADRLLLDNMDNKTIQKALDQIQDRVSVEISGGITIERLPSLAKMGVDAISIGALTHGAKSVDISMKIELDV